MEIKIERATIQNWAERSKANPNMTLYIYCRKSEIRKDKTLSGWCESFHEEDGANYDYEIARFKAGNVVQAD